MMKHFSFSAQLGISLFTLAMFAACAPKPDPSAQQITLDGEAGGVVFDGLGLVNGGGATSVLLKDYPEPQRSQILDMVYKPMFGASVSALFVEIPGDGNSTQGSMPSHMHTRDDLNYSRGYTWWIMQEAQKRNPELTLDGTAWSAPAWIGNGNFWSQDAADYYVKWLEGLRDVYGLKFSAIGCRNEKGDSYEFVKMLRKTLDANGFEDLPIHAFDNWYAEKLNFVFDMEKDEELRNAIDIIGGHVFYEERPVSEEQKALAAKMGKRIWDTEDHVYKKGFDCLISLVECFNLNYIKNNATKIVNWYDIAGIYPLEPYSEDPPTVLAYEPWSGHYKVRQALWGYAHYGQFCKVGWEYLNGGCTALQKGGNLVTLRSGKDYSVIIQTKGATETQQIYVKVGGGLSRKDLCLWVSNEQEQFVQQADVELQGGVFCMTLEPNHVYSLSTTRGQQKGAFADIPASKPFPMPYRDNFDQYTKPEQRGYLPFYTADICGAFEIAPSPDGNGMALQQVVDLRTNSWAPDWRHYSIIGDREWTDYEVSANVWLKKGDTAGLMGRIEHVGWGYGIIPKGYYMDIDDQGNCQIVISRGKVDKKKLVGDAEQQALIKRLNDMSEGGELILAQTRIKDFSPEAWHKLTLRFSGEDIIGMVDGVERLKAKIGLYPKGMAGLIVGQEGQKVSTPYFDDIIIKPVGAEDPSPTPVNENVRPLYP